MDLITQVYLKTLFKCCQLPSNQQNKYSNHRHADSADSWSGLGKDRVLSHFSLNIRGSVSKNRTGIRPASVETRS